MVVMNNSVRVGVRVRVRVRVRVKTSRAHTLQNSFYIYHCLLATKCMHVALRPEVEHTCETSIVEPRN